MAFPTDFDDVSTGTIITASRNNAITKKLGLTTIATSATTGHFSMPTSAGIPSGDPANGIGSMVYDSTNDQLYINEDASAGSWEIIGVTYESGTFDIGVTQGSVDSSSKGKYIKIGNLVTVWCQVDNGTDTTNAAILSLTGMPFAAVSPNTTGHGAVGAVSYPNYMGGNVISAVIEATTTTVKFSNLNAADLVYSDCTSTWSVRFTITYQTT